MVEGDKVSAEASNEASGDAELELLCLVSDGDVHVRFEQES